MNNWRRKKIGLPNGWKWEKLSNVVKEDRQMINPQEYPEKEFLLVTMDCVERDIGKLLKIIKHRGKEIKSGKYKFNGNHILYGKLRPYLNKVYMPNKKGKNLWGWIVIYINGTWGYNDEGKYHYDPNDFSSWKLLEI